MLPPPLLCLSTLILGAPRAEWLQPAGSVWHHLSGSVIDSQSWGHAQTPTDCICREPHSSQVSDLASSCALLAQTTSPWMGKQCCIGFPTSSWCSGSLSSNIHYSQTIYFSSSLCSFSIKSTAVSITWCLVQRCGTTYLKKALHLQWKMAITFCFRLFTLRPEVCLLLHSATCLQSGNMLPAFKS